MKKSITIAIVILFVLGLGYYLSTISTPAPVSGKIDFDLSNISNLTEPLPLSAEDHIFGNPRAVNVLVAYEDFQCPACANFEPILMQLPQALKDTKLVFRHFPLLSLHKNAGIAALASETASAQGKFWEFNKILYEKQIEWSELLDPSDNFYGYAQAVGVGDLEKFKSELASQTYKIRVQDNIKEALGLQVQGTPTLYFNGKQLQLGDVNSIKAQAEKLYK